MKKYYPSSDEMRKEVDRKANELKVLSITKKSNMTDFWSGVRKEKYQCGNQTAFNSKSRIS